MTILMSDSVALRTQLNGDNHVECDASIIQMSFRQGEFYLAPPQNKSLKTLILISINWLEEDVNK